MEEADNVIRILRESVKAIKGGDANELKNLSNQTIHAATINQDADNIVIAVLIYALGKIFERDHYREMKGWDKFERIVLENLEDAIKNLEKNNLKGFRENIGTIRNIMNEIDSVLSMYIQDVFRKAEINKAFKIYEHGLSSAQTADLLGITLWELSSYIGQSTISEANVVESMPLKKRIKIAEDMFS